VASLFFHFKNCSFQFVGGNVMVMVLGFLVKIKISMVMTQLSYPEKITLLRSCLATRKEEVCLFVGFF